MSSGGESEDFIKRRGFSKKKKKKKKKGRLVRFVAPKLDWLMDGKLKTSVWLRGDEGSRCENKWTQGLLKMSDTKCIVLCLYVHEWHLSYNN